MSFLKSTNTFVLSDLHLTEAGKEHPRNQYWKLFKNRKFFIDQDFSDLCDHLQQVCPIESELVLNGDIFDFDSVLAMPQPKTFSISLLEKLRGLNSSEEKSVFKIKVILKDHSIWIDALKKYLSNGNKIIFIIGNHDVELHWPQVQNVIINLLDPQDIYGRNIRFCEWFYISNQDTLIEHGNQYDDYCLCQNPIHPMIFKNKKYLIRLPFANLAGKYMLNGMGLMNPHVPSSFIKSSFKEYLIFFFKYVIKTQPFLLLSWLWSAFVTLYISIKEGLQAAIKDPLMVMKRVDEIALKSNTQPRIVRALASHHVHPAIYKPIKILRELWLDRAILLFFVFYSGYHLFSFLNIFGRASFWWFLGPIMALLPLYIFYARSVKSNVNSVEEVIYNSVKFTTHVTKVKRVVLGHTHHIIHKNIDDIEVINTGTWSPAFHDVECTRPYGRKCLLWIKTKEGKDSRSATLYEWKDKQLNTFNID